jgi:hypothetical protein
MSAAPSEDSPLPRSPHTATASGRCDTLWTEDLTDGQSLLGVRIENPLKDDRPQIHTDWHR